MYFYRMLLFLIGMPGAGKTFWLTRFAHALQYKMTDLDQFIEQREGCSVPDLFENGESYFRHAEHNALMVLSQTPGNMVIATGGGTPCHSNNMTVMKQSGLTVYLETSVRQLCHRLEGEGTTRPLLGQLSYSKRFERLSQIFSERQYYYQQADLVFQTETDNFADIIVQIQSRIQQNHDNHV